MRAFAKEALAFRRAIRWLERNSAPGLEGVFVSSRIRKSYPEVSGYLIPSLIKFGEIETALRFSRWLVATQSPDGYWLDAHGEGAYLFDTGQVVRGLLAAHAHQPSIELETAMIRSLVWVKSLIDRNGVLRDPDSPQWGDSVPREILLLSLAPLLTCSKVVADAEAAQKISKAISVLIAGVGNGFPLQGLTHFHAYVVEALIELELIDLAADSMKEVRGALNQAGTVPGVKGSSWVCSTGLFQYSCILYRLGDSLTADIAFSAALKMQNISGGWFGSYGRGRAFARFWAKLFPNKAWYFPADEISWAVKYFLDALHLRLKDSFQRQAPKFSSTIDPNDGRLELIRVQFESLGTAGRVLDAGAGKGRYSTQLSREFPEFIFTCTDISSEVMKDLPGNISKQVASLTCLPFKDESFDFVFAVESLEHAVNIRAALSEFYRVIKPGGRLLIIDKNKFFTLFMPREPWEIWFSRRGLSRQLRRLGFRTKSHYGVPFEGNKAPLFFGWEGRK